MKHSYIILLLLVFGATSLVGQKVLKTESGQRILLVDNGSWRLLSPVENIAGESITEGTSLNSFDSPKQGKYPVNADQRLEIQNLLTNFLSDEAQLCVNIEMNHRKINQLKVQKKSSKKDKEEVKKLEFQIESTLLEIEKDKETSKSISKLIEVSNNLLEGEVKNKDKVIASLKNDINPAETFNSGMGGVVEPDKKEIIASAKPIKKVQPPAYPTTFSIDEDHYNASISECEIVFNGYDKDIGHNRKEVKTQPFFSYSQEKMKPYFKSEDFLTCNANVAKIGKKHFLTLKIRIRSKDATKTYGSLQADNNLVIELINGRKIYGRNINIDKGEIESYTGHTLYKGIFELRNDDLKDLKKHYVDNLAIIWSSGYEQYDIFNVDFIKNQLECLSK